MSTILPTTLTLKDGRSVVLRTGMPYDAAALLRFLPQVLAESDHLVLTPAEGKLSLEEEVAWVRSYLDGPASLLIVAIHGDEVIGNLGFGSSRHRRTAHLGELGISLRAAWRERGIGSAMLQMLCEWADSHEQIEKLQLGVFAGNTRAIALYRRFGFVEEGRFLRQFRLAPGRYDDEVRMCRFVMPRRQEPVVRSQ